MKFYHKDGMLIIDGEFAETGAKYVMGNLLQPVSDLPDNVGIVNFCFEGNPDNVKHSDGSIKFPGEPNNNGFSSAGSYNGPMTITNNVYEDDGVGVVIFSSSETSELP